MSDVMDQFHTVGASLANKLSNSCKKDYEKLGQAAAAMAEATTFDSSNGNQKLLQALRVSPESELQTIIVHRSQILNLVIFRGNEGCWRSSLCS